MATLSKPRQTSVFSIASPHTNAPSSSQKAYSKAPIPSSCDDISCSSSPQTSLATSAFSLGQACPAQGANLEPNCPNSSQARKYFYRTPGIPGSDKKSIDCFLLETFWAGTLYICPVIVYRKEMRHACNNRQICRKRQSLVIVE